MPGKIFVSCGQADAEERKVAADLEAWLQGQGFDPYVAIQTQSLQDVNSGIIGNLRTSDCYIFVDFAREKIRKSILSVPERRGSLFTQQELAIAYLMDFEHVIFLRERHVRLEGLGQYLLTNAVVFDNKSEVLPIIQREISQRGWDKSYTRHLVVTGPIYAGQWQFTDHAGSHNQHIWHIAVENRRTDTAAFDTITRLSKITHPNGQETDSPDRNFLKWAGKTKTFANTILPCDHACFDCLSLDAQNPRDVYLHSEEDRPPRQPIITIPGNYILHYQVFAKGFSPLVFDIQMVLTGNFNTTIIRLM